MNISPLIYYMKNEDGEVYPTEHPYIEVWTCESGIIDVVHNSKKFEKYEEKKINNNLG